MPGGTQLHFPRGLSCGPIVVTREMAPDIHLTLCNVLYAVLTCAIVESKSFLYFILEFLKI